MYGNSSTCVFVVFCNPGAGGDEALDRWYMEVHGPDAFANGSFSALHRYEAVGAYDARFLAVWEGSFTSPDEARSWIVPNAVGLKEKGRITDDMVVVWSAFHFLTDAALSAEASPVNTLTLVEGSSFEVPGASVYRYGNLALYESREDPEKAAVRWSDRGSEGMAPHGPYKGIFQRPDSWPAEGVDATEPWTSHWRPIGSLYADGR